MRLVRSRRAGGTWCLVLASLGGLAVPAAAAPTAEDALKLVPVQKDVEFDVPAAGELSKCTIKAEQFGKQVGWVVRDPSGQILRRFVDTNGDNTVDQWSYYENGIEVYRDIDQNHNGKADQYRWLNTGGSRWGLDTDEDGKIDAWKLISAEEVTSELVKAVGERDAARFKRLLLTSEEAASLGLGEEQAKALAARVAKAPEKFQAFLAGQQAAGSKFASTEKSKLRWTHFGGSLPGIVPAGTDGSTRDVLAYENVVAMIEKDDKHDQLPVGTLVRVGDLWRLVDAPAEGEAEWVFFHSPSAAAPAMANAGSTGDKNLQELLKKLEQIDQKLASAAPAEQKPLNEQRCDVLEQIAEATGVQERETWIRQLAESISAATLGGSLPDGVARLKALAEKLVKNSSDDELVAFVEYRYLQADYALKIQTEGDFAAVQQAWLKGLEDYVARHPKSDDTADAMLQLGVDREFAGLDNEAKAWYAKIVEAFPGTPHAAKAAGATTRLDSVGKAIELSGQTVSGTAARLSSFRGKVVVVHYWASWCQPAINALPMLKEVQAKYAKDGLVIFSISLDSKKQDLENFLKTNKLPWSTIWEEGGLDSPLANKLGILTVPSMLLIDKQGKVAIRAIDVTQLDKEIGALVR